MGRQHQPEPPLLTRRDSSAEMQAGIKESETPTCVVFAGGLAIIFGLWFLRIGFYMICGLVGLVLGILLVPAVIVGLLRLLS